MKPLHDFLGYISNTVFFDFIHLDFLAHFFIGYLIMFILMKKKIKVTNAYFVVFILSLFKEVFDSFSLTNTLQENIKDLIVSMTLPTIMLLIHKFIKKDKYKI